MESKDFKPNLDLQGELRTLIETRYGALDAMQPNDRDKLFRDIYFDFCEVMGREFDLQLFIYRLKK